MLLLQFDGMLQLLGEQPQLGGFLGYGWLISRDGVVIAYGFGLFAGRKTVNSNLAEYLALIEGLDALLDLRITNTPIVIHGDSKSVIDQMNGAASISSLSTHNLYRRARKLAGQFDHISWGWVPRKNNKQADDLSRRSLNQLYIQPHAYETAMEQLNARSPGYGEFMSLLDLRVYNPGL
jgi:ribonuclease HI